MTMADELNWMVDLPEYIIDSFWSMEIDFHDSTLWGHDDRLINFDKYIEDVNIPNTSLSTEKTELGMLLYKKLEDYSSITLTFCDDVDCTCNKFFDKWFSHIYDKNKYCLHKNWRNFYVNLNLSLKRYFKKGGKWFGGAFQRAQGVMDTVNSISGNNLSFMNYSNIEEKKCITYEAQVCYPVKIGELSFSHGASGDRQEFTVELECARVFQKF